MTPEEANNLTPDELDEALSTNDGEYDEDAEIIFSEARRCFDRLAELEAWQPRVWDASTINDAPEGMYRLGATGKAQIYWEYAFLSKADIAEMIRRNDPAIIEIWRFFGPEPQPPVTP